MKVLRWAVFALAMFVAFFACAITGYVAYQSGLSQTEAPAACVVAQQQPVITQACQPLQDFGPEMAFPSKANGPAIAELWNPNNGFCALVRINSGESLDWAYSGAWWQAANQDVLNVRWPHHLAEYQAKPGNDACKVFTSANDVP